MKALNAQERNSAILRFVLWLLICVVIISIPVIFLVILPAERNKLVSAACQQEKSILENKIQYEKDTFAVRIGKLYRLIKDTDESEIQSFNTELLIMASTFEADTLKKDDWQVKKARDIAEISRNLIRKEKLVIPKDDVVCIPKEKFNNIIVELQTISATAKKVGESKSQSSLKGGLTRLSQDLDKQIRILQSSK
jgi:hypothetical protein